MLKKIMFIHVLILIGCDSDKAEEPTELSKWQDNNISSYSFNYVTNGFSPSVGKWRIQVQNDEVIHTQLVEKGNVDGELLLVDAPTINDLFIEIEECDGAIHCEVTQLTLDETYDFPLKATFSYTSESDGFIVSEFEVQ